jgi:NADP-dependent 3-hydroxy acid dehydrogenase YdfG
MPAEQNGSHRVAVITGATGGIGSAIASSLAHAGWNLVLTARSVESLGTLRNTVCPEAVFVAGDVTDAQLPGKLLSTALEQFGRCDVCFNNAGFIEVGTVEAVDIDRICAMVRVNVEAAYRMAYVFARHFVQQGSGHLINVSSVLGKKTRPTAGAYAGTKYAIEALSEALRMELSRTNVQVSCIQPGLVRTKLHDRWEVHPSELMGIEQPLSPDDVARMVMFILDQPPHVRIPQLMILPKDHEI